MRGCIVSQDLSVLNLVIVKKGENDLPGLTDTEKPRMRGPKRASKIRKLFNLSKEDDVRKYVNTYRRSFTTKTGEIHYLGIFSQHVAVLGDAIWLFKTNSSKCSSGLLSYRPNWTCIFLGNVVWLFSKALSRLEICSFIFCLSEV